MNLKRADQRDRNNESERKAEALDKVNECLPQWVDAAMKGEYPWVIPVTIVCGGGHQILSEVVDTWIRENENVPNAPRDTHS